MSKITVDGHELALVHEDKRRRIFEYSGPEGSIQYTEVLAPAVLGNHYHKNKDENFEILEGGGVLILQVLFSANENPMLEHVHIEFLDPHTNSRYRVPPYMAHAFVLKQGTKLICRSDKQWDEQDAHPRLLVAKT